MNARTRTLALVLAAQLTTLAWGTTLVAADTIPFERRLPRDVVAYISFRNVADLRTQWGKTLQGRLTQDDSLTEFRAAIETQIGELSKHVEEQVGMSLVDLLGIPHGELAAALTFPADGKPAAFLFLDFGEREESIHKLLERLDAGVKEQGWERAAQEVDDTKIVILRRPAADGNQVAHDAIAYFVKDSFLVMATDGLALKSVLNRWEGKNENVFAENGVFRYIADRCRDEAHETAPLMTWFVDPIGMVKAMLATQPQAPPQIGMVMTMLPLLGVDRFKGMGGTFDMARGDFDMVSRTLIYTEPPVQGLLNAFQFDAVDMAPPKWVTTQASSYFSINWNISKAWTAAEALVDMLQGPGALARLVDQLAENEGTGGVHAKKDFIDVLTGRIHVIGELSGRDEDADEKSLIAAEVKNPAAARATLRKLARIPGVPVKERDFQGETLYQIEAGADDDVGEAVAMGVAVTENHLMFASDIKVLERLLRGTQGRETLADSPAYKRIAARFPEKTASIGFNREDNTLQSLLAFLKSPAASQYLGDDAQSLVEKLPDADVLKKYMSSSGSYMQSDERGYRIVSFSLKKDVE